MSWACSRFLAHADGPRRRGLWRPFASLVATLALSGSAVASSEIARPPGRIDDRGYELVSQADKNSYQVAQTLPISTDGRRVLYALLAGGTPDSNSGQAVLAATRTPNGWRSHDALPPPGEQLAGTYVLGAATGDLSSWIGSALEGLGTTDQASDVSVARLSDAGAQQLLRTFPIYFGSAGISVVVSDALRHVLVAVPRGIDPSLPGYVASVLSPDNANVFDLATDPPELVSAMPATGLPPACGLKGSVGAMDFPGDVINAVSEHWISSDGSAAFFSTRGDVCSNPRELYRRDLNAHTTTLVSSPPLAGDPDNGIDRFLQATPDGSLVFLRSATSYDPADDADGNSSDRDVYRWTAATGALRCITCLVPSANVPLTTSSRFANAVIAEDGSHVYFPSAAQGADAPAPATQSAPNLYVWRASDDSVHDIGRITISGPNGLANVPYFGGQATPDGQVLVFRADRPELDPLSGAANGGTYQYYRYDDRDRSLTCVSCPPGGPATTDVPLDLSNAVARFAVAPRARAVTDDGSMVFFSSHDTLAADDVNRTWDIYEWHDGVVKLITSGLTSYPGDVQPYPVGASADGRDFLFQDPARLTWEPQDSSYHLYDARIGGGFPPPPAQPACEGEQCQGLPASPPALPDPGSATLRGARDVPPTAHFTVRRLTSAQRTRLARLGRVTLAVRVDRPGKVSAFAQATLGRRIRIVASASVRARKAGDVALTLRLARAARRHLATTGRLRLVIAVRFSRTRERQRVSLSLRSARR